MRRVYVAGAMNDNNILGVLDNISVGIQSGAKLLELGYAPFVPHLDVFFKIQNGRNYKVPMQNYYDYTLEWLKASEAVLVCEGFENSVGTKNEINVAIELGIPVFYSIETLKEGLKFNKESKKLR